MSVGILGRSGVMRATAEKFVLVVGVDGDFALFFKLIELRTVRGKVGAEVL